MIGSTKKIEGALGLTKKEDPEPGRDLKKVQKEIYEKKEERKEKDKKVGNENNNKKSKSLSVSSASSKS